MKLSTLQIGRCGELLVQLKLLLFGIESAPMTTDSGIDLVAYSPRTGRASTIQVKTNLKPKPSGGKGKLSIDWWIPENSPAEMFALLELEKNRIWILTKDELALLSQQKSGGRYHFFIMLQQISTKRRDRKAIYEADFNTHLLENKISRLF